MGDLLVTGRGTSGSWQIRGEQLGRAIGATVAANAIDVGGYRAAIIVKRPTPDILRRLHRLDVPVIWDIVDAWPQPVGNSWGVARCKEWLVTQFEDIQPAALVAATQSMAEDCMRWFDVPVLALPHHARPAQPRNPIRPTVRVVGYEGSAAHLGRWAAVAQAQCKRRDWQWVLNPSALAVLDIVIAMRDDYGYAAREWKSNVKLANAQGSGTPCVMGQEAGYCETDNDAALWAETEDQLSQAFDTLTPQETRQQVSSRLQSATPTLDAVAATYKSWLYALKF
jgi:hypothetical protein